MGRVLRLVTGTSTQIARRRKEDTDLDVEME